MDRQTDIQTDRPTDKQNVYYNPIVHASNSSLGTHRTFDDPFTGCLGDDVEVLYPVL